MWKKDSKLPENFQDNIIKYELSLKKEIKKDTIVNLITLYSKGMNYYNLIGNYEFEEYYRDKSNNLLFNPQILKVLEGGKRKKKKDDNNNLNDIQFNKFHEQRKIELELKNTLLEIVEIKLKEFDLNFEKIDKAIADSIIEQKTLFESNKREKVSIKKNQEYDEKKDNEKGDNQIKNKKKSHHFRSNTCLRGDIINSQNLMLTEIEKCVEKNMDEMYKSIDEIKISYEKEIKEATEKNQTKKIGILKRDLQGEIESLTLQFEEQRDKVIDNIMQKYSKC